VEAGFKTYANFTTHYSAVFEIYDLNAGEESNDMKVTLIYDNLPIQLEEYGGLWLGLGFDSSTMLGSDIVICQWDDVLAKATCSDHKADAVSHITPPLDDVNNIKTVSGVKGDNRLEIKFRRHVNTGDNIQDTSLA
jgi:hypothetical protein